MGSDKAALKPRPEINITLSDTDVTQRDSSGWKEIADWYNSLEAWQRGLVSDTGILNAYNKIAAR